MWRGIGAAGVSAAGSLLGGFLGNKASAKQAQKQMDFQLYMSNTAYQRSMADMKAAGLNPMLAYSQGGASTPPGAKAEMRDIITPAVQSALTARRNAAEIKMLDAQAANLKEDSVMKISNTLLNNEQREKVRADAEVAREDASMLAERNKHLRAETVRLLNVLPHEMRAQISNAKAAKAVSSIEEAIASSKVGKVLRWIERGKEVINPMSGVRELRQWNQMDRSRDWRR